MGRVDRYGANQGYGFIIPENGGPKAFVCREGTRAVEEHLENNDEVSYEAFQGTEGPEAKNVART